MMLAKVKALALASVLAVSLSPPFAVMTASSAFAASALQSLDPDKEGTVDLNEAKAAASALFDSLDVDHDGTLDRKELKDRISAEDWKTADPDNDKTISKGRVSRLRRSRFQARKPGQRWDDRRQGVEDPGWARPASLAAEVNGDAGVLVSAAFRLSNWREG